jgi:RimJ/RimL family protein N-acetyltransferase
VWLHVVADNERGIRAYERVGFKREGILRQEHFRDGRYLDTVTMAILREEWKQ